MNLKAIFISAFVTALYNCMPVCAQSTASIETALAVIKSQEDNHKANFTTARWLIKTDNGILDPKTKIVTPNKSDPLITSTIETSFNPSQGKFRIRQEGVRQWINGVAPYNWSEEIFTSDGKVDRFFRRSKPGNQTPNEPPAFGLGTIRTSDITRTLKEYGGKSGIGYFAPYFNGVNLYYFLNTSHKSGNLTLLNSTNHIFEFLAPSIDEQFKERSKMKIFYDTQKGGVVHAEFIAGPEQKPGVDPIWRTIDITWEKIDEIFVPKKVTQKFVDSGLVIQLFYENMEISHADDDTNYNFSFPSGTKVTDWVEKINYTISDGIKKEQLSIVDFIDKNDLRNKEGKSYSYLTITGMLFSAIVIGLIIFRKVFYGRWLASIPIAFVIFSESAFCVDQDNFGNWIAPGSAKNALPISQCGLNVTLFALEYYGAPYDLKFLASILPPSQSGIKLSDIKKALQLHGVGVIAREQVSFEDLDRCLEGGTLALFPVKMSPELNHYLLATKHNGRKIVIDPPVSVLDFNKSVDKKSIDALGGTVLFLTKPTKEAAFSQSSLVELSDKSIDLGTFEQGTNEYSTPVKRIIKVKNKTNKHIGLKNIVTPCGCMVIDKSIKVIDPLSETEILFTIIMGGWGPGASKKTVTISFLDGSTQTVDFSAVIKTVAENQNITLASNILSIRLPFADRGKVFQYFMPFDFPKGKLDDIKLEVDDERFICKIIPVSDKAAKISVQIYGDKFPVVNNAVQASVKMRTTSSSPPVVLDVFVQSIKWYNLTTQLANCRRGEKGTVNGTIQVPFNQIKLAERKGHVSGNEVTEPKLVLKSSNFCYTFNLPKDIKPGIAVLRFYLSIDSDVLEFVSPVEITSNEK